MSSNYYGDAVTAETLLSDLTFLVMAFAVVTMFLLAGIVSKRVDRHRILTTSTGFVSYFLFFGIYGLVNLLRFKYFYDARLTCTIIGILFYSSGVGTGDGKGSRDAKHSKDHRDTLTGSALSGIISLMKEILASDASLQEIDHGDEKLYFAYGNYTIAVVFAKTETPEVTYRLQKFHVEFENEYRAVLEDWQGNLREFDGVPSLLQRTFAA